VDFDIFFGSMVIDLWSTGYVEVPIVEGYENMENMEMFGFKIIVR
jgi:hypothetical protein